MASTQVQDLLRFLSQDAKVPLATAMSRVIALQKSSLTTAEEISKADHKLLQEVFQDEKLAKQVLNAAKRVSKKRAAPSEQTASPRKKVRGAEAKENMTPFQRECALSLPTSSASDQELSNIAVLTNRAPLVLAFAVCVLKYTMPEQPISSRLSLAQAVVSANSRSKAVHLGIESGASAEQEGWGQGQPVVKVLGRDIRVLKRWGYSSREGMSTEGSPSLGDTATSESMDDTLGRKTSEDMDSPPPLWGIDLEALKNTHQNPRSGGLKPNNALPIFTPESARSYLSKAFAQIPGENGESTKRSERKSAAQIESEREDSLGHLLSSIDKVCQSWASTLSTDELDRRAWAWYVRVRPEVQSGAGGWGEKGRVKLSSILELRRQP
ncbi:hypothetical protein BDV59DRAFT_82226 [Aspergillus ambiguus]|uniref:uncharacterized protein n=1 Tax=Aspergillus ambiguus TaxID=176160 RepID=UPI003CCC9A3F